MWHFENNIRIACILTTEKQTKEFEVSKHTTEYLIINKLNENGFENGFENVLGFLVEK